MAGAGIPLQRNVRALESSQVPVLEPATADTPPPSVRVPLGPAPLAPVRGDRPADWRRSYTAASIAADALAAFLAAMLAVVVRFGGSNPDGYVKGSIALPLLWVAVVALNRAYEHRFLGVGNEEFHRVLRAGVALMAVVAFASYTTKAELARGYVLIAIPTLVALSLLSRCVLRGWLHRQRAVERCISRTLLVGSAAAVRATTAQLANDPRHGMTVVGAWVSEGSENPSGAAHEGEDSGDESLPGITAMVSALKVDIVTVLPSADLSGTALRRLAWSLEQTEAELLVCSGLVEITGARITVRPIAHRSMLHVTGARLSGPSRVAKASFDRGGALLGLLVLAPLLAVVAAWIWAGDRRSPLFRQTRVGRNGREFTLYKFRTMVPNADALKADLAGSNENDGLLFKMRSDPRVTSVGRVLRRYSVDELPQLLNVVRGQMSLVGPRPPLPAEVREYAGDVHRRMVVKPGLTGLWQVSGRSDLSWAESVRLDLRYVENWSLGYDLAILWRTARAVLGRSGAY